MRCSALPLAFRCPGSLRSDTGVLIDTYHEAAEDGSDVHRLLASHPEGDAPQALLAELSDEARILYFTGAKMWREHISAWMPNSEAEVPFEIRGLSGHIDRMAINGKSIVVLDWKSGRKDISHKHQGFGYAWGELERNPECDVATVHFAWLRTQEIESYTVSRQRAEEWAQYLDSQVIRWDGVYHAGEHCTGCRRFASCPAHAEMNRGSLALVTGEPLNLAIMDGPELATVYRRLSPLLSQIEILQKAIRTEVRVRGGVDDVEGRRLYYKPTAGNREVDALKAWPVLTELLTDEELAPCLKVGIGDVEEAVANKAANAPGAKRGAKKAAKEKLQQALEAAGAVSRTPGERFTDERVCEDK